MNIDHVAIWTRNLERLKDFYTSYFNARSGENIGLAVVLDDSSDRSVLGFNDWIRAHLAEHKHPARWYLLDEIPRTSRGKINRDTVRQACLPATPLNLREVLNRAAQGSA
jgi:acyl-CoA synthetase (AMP-forming)/AMP-acid ligase II